MQEPGIWETSYHSSLLSETGDINLKMVRKQDKTSRNAPRKLHLGTSTKKPLQHSDLRCLCNGYVRNAGKPENTGFRNAENPTEKGHSAPLSGVVVRKSRL